jgi:hypothetical protein
VRVSLKAVVAGVCALAILVSLQQFASAQAGEPVKPYILFITDTSGSMNNSTGSGPPSCGGSDSKLDHAKCAVTNIVNTYGDVVIGYGSFRQDINESDTNCGNGCGASLASCDDGGDEFQVLVPLLEGTQNRIIDWNDLICNTCSRNTALDPGLNPELEAGGNTPLAGTLRGAKRYWQGLPLPSDPGTPFWSGPGDDPIRDDPLSDQFLPGGEQCRPYIVVLLTDGAETCTGTPEDAAGELLVTSVDGTDYRIETKPIGFGISPGDAEIEAIARAGGNPGDGSGGANEGFYATNEAEISAALATIIQDSLKSETCNDLDDDCDTEIDEDWPLKGSACSNNLFGICNSPGTFVCRGDGSGIECILDNPGHPNPGDFEETCNGLDDDCDGKVDEAPADCTGCQPFELCDGKDNDCDGRFDEGPITRSCGVNIPPVCTEGTETCVEQISEQPSGEWGACTGDPPNPPEQCNGIDDDCDGTVDGLQEECSDLIGGNPNTGICVPGTRTCPTDGSGWGDCLGEVVPEATDPCDGLDNDCDTLFDEDFVPSDCSSTCGMGTTECNNGNLSCNASNTPMDEVCNDFDDDCDGVVDEDIPPGGDCLDDGRCEPGTLICDASTNGSFECRGGVLPGIEICDCEDNDCDGEIDEEDPNPLCAPGASCVACQCAFPCEPGEFPCPVGRYCEDDFCLLDPCYGVDCQPDGSGNQTECVDGDCVPSCDLVTCPQGQVCFGPDGSCRPDNCLTFPDRCTNDEFCVAGDCVEDPCFDVDCPAAGDYCVDGNCVASCAGVECPEGQRCERGSCTTHPCGENCPEGEVCDEDDGECKSDPCRFVQCPTGQACNPSNGTCEQDPCLGVECPEAGQVCVGGSCYDPDDLKPPTKGPPPEYVSPGGGGGCAAGDGTGGGLATLGLGLLMLALVARRRRVR